MKRKRYLKLYIVSLLCGLLLTGCMDSPRTAQFLFSVADSKTLEPRYMTENGDLVDIPGLDATSYSSMAVELTENGYLFPARKNGLWGYISADGKWKIEPQYLYASNFHEDCAQVALSKDNCACIDSWGNIRFQWSSGEIIGWFGDGVSIRYQETNQDIVPLDFLNPQGNTLATNILIDRSCLMTMGKVIEEKTVYFETLHFSEGFLVASLNGKYGYLNTEGKWIIEPKYEDAQPFSEGLAAVCLNGKYGYINYSGKEIVPCIYERAQSFSEGLGAVKLDNGKEWAWQFINPDGSVAFQFEHRCFPAEIGPDTLVFHEGLCCAREEKYWVYYDKSGNTAFTIDTWIAEPFQHGLAYVQDNQYVGGYIDTRGNWIYQWDTSIVWDELMNKNSE